MTLDLSSDLIQIAKDAVYTRSKDESGKDNPAHHDVSKWNYFVTNLIYRDNEDNDIECYMNIDVKKNKDGYYFYSFAIEKGNAPQTLLAGVTDIESATISSNNNIPQTENVVNTNSMQENGNNAHDLLLTISRAMGGTGINESDVSALISNHEILSAYTGLDFSNDTEAKIRKYISDTKTENQRANDIISRMLEVTGLSFDYDATLPMNCPGYYEPETKKIVLNPAHPKKLDYAVVHELTHFVENKKGYNEYVKNLKDSRFYKDFLIEKYQGKEENFFAETFDLYYEAYKDNDDKTLNELIEREMIAKINEELINSDSDTLKRLANNDTGIKAVFRNIAEFFEEIYHKLNGNSEKAYALKMARKFRGLIDSKNIEKITNKGYNEIKKYSKNDKYTQLEYENYGWARANDILNEGQNADYRSKFAMAISGQANFYKSKKGEYIIPVSDIYDSSFRGINNVLVFAKGKIDDPIITKVIEIYEYDETILDRIRRNIYELEWRGIQQETEGIIRQYNANDSGINDYRGYIESFRHNNDNGVGRRDSQQTASNEKQKQYSITKENTSNSQTFEKVEAHKRTPLIYTMPDIYLDI